MTTKQYLLHQLLKEKAHQTQTSLKPLKHSTPFYRGVFVSYGMKCIICNTTEGEKYEGLICHHPICRALHKYAIITPENCQVTDEIKDRYKHLFQDSMSSTDSESQSEIS